VSSFADLDAIARALPSVDAVLGRSGRPEYRVRGKAFAFARPPRKDAIDPDTLAPMDDVIVLRTSSLEAKDALLADPALPLFTTHHFDGWPGVLLRARDLHLVPSERLEACVVKAWEAVAPKALVRQRVDGARDAPPRDGGE